MSAPPAPAVLRTLRELGRFLLPGACLGCQGRLPQQGCEDLVCARCLTRLRPLSSPGCARCAFPLGTGASSKETCLECASWSRALTGARSAFVLEPPADRLVHALKYGGWSQLAEPMGLRMARLELTDAAGRDGVVVPVATTRSRKRRRGYNQAERLARIVAGERRMPLHDALVRTGRSRTQVSLHPTQRRANVENVFRVRPERAASLVGRPVLLIDDVLTTGATVQSAAQALLKAGSGDVTAVTFARALPFRAAPLG